MKSKSIAAIISVRLKFPFAIVVPINPDGIAAISEINAIYSLLLILIETSILLISLSRLFFAYRNGLQFLYQVLIQNSTVYP